MHLSAYSRMSSGVHRECHPITNVTINVYVYVMQGVTW
jgi:hypothetical protein